MTAPSLAARQPVWPALSWGLVGLACLLASLVIGLTVGAYDLLWHHWSEGGADVFWHIRLPRVLMGLLAGAALGVAGALVQGVFRNPLADPGLIGVTGGAALGAGLAILLGAEVGLGWAGPWGLIVPAFVGGLVVTVLSWRLASRQGQLSVSLLLLMGVAINALAGSGLGLLSYLSTDQQLRALTFWLLGSLSGSQWPTVIPCAGVVALALARPLLVPAHARALNALALGEGQARLMGVDVRATQVWSIAAVAMSVGAVTALCGMVGFVGLLAPHLIRLVRGPDHRWVLPGSAVVGGCLVVLADGAARTWVAPAELPLGVLTGLLGAPVFVWMLWRRLPAA